MRIESIAKLVGALIVIAIMWKFMPTVRHADADATTSEARTPDAISATATKTSCVPGAQKAFDLWGNKVRSLTMMPPPIDVNEWSALRDDVDASISAAESGCDCELESCTKSREALSELRSIITEMDSTVRNGSPPPSDLVQRQGEVDTKLDSAMELMKNGK
jgi:hypothetical protein